MNECKTRKMRVVLSVEVSELPAADLRRDEREDSMETGDLDGQLDDASPGDIAEFLAGSLVNNPDVFAGTGVWLRISDCTAASADWE